MNINATTVASNSATTNESHTPSIPIIKGKKMTADVWNTRVLKKDMIAEINPLLSAVKKDEPKIAIPVNKKEKEKI